MIPSDAWKQDVGGKVGGNVKSTPVDCLANRIAKFGTVSRGILRLVKAERGKGVPS